MNPRYFHRLYETPADQGAAVEEPAETEDDLLDDGEPAEEQEPARFTMEELAEHLGPTFADRFAGKHEGPEALRKFAESYQNAQTLISRGGKTSAEDAALFESLGMAPPEPEPQPEPELNPLYGAPWAEPSSWDELVDLAGRNPRAAAEFALRQEDFPDETKAWFFANWASVDAAGAFAYNQAATTEAARQYADQQTAEIRAQVEPLVYDRMASNADRMLERSRETIPGFQEHGEAIQGLMAERQARDPRYHEWFLNAPLDTQVQEMRDLTGIAIFRAQPAAEAQAKEDLAEAEESKSRSKTETTRTSGTREKPSAQSEMKKKNLADFKKLQEQGML